ncbi:MAG: complex I subunit 5 family protein [Bacillota bacterium]
MAAGPSYTVEQAVVIEATSALPLLAVVVPMLGAVALVWAARRSEKARNAVAVLSSLLAALFVFAMAPFVKEGTVVFSIGSFMGYPIGFRVDGFAFIVSALASFVWCAATLFSVEYMEHEHARSRYYLFLLVTLGCTLGVFMARDLLTLFLFFELMTFSSYILVIHEQNAESFAAGDVYLYMGVFGGLALLFGIMLLYYYAGTVELSPMLDKILRGGGNPYFLAVLFALGFGTKAGMMPLHIWLPKAHPVAPSPASALLSGILIKAGAYGLTRCLLLIFTSAHGDDLALRVSSMLGYAVLWIGQVTMLLAALMALLQTNVKRILAYSSVSQMGYILTALGIAGYLGHEGAMGFGAALYHMVNHGLFKATAFMAVGSMYIRTHELDLRKLGGLYRRFPFTSAIYVCAFLAITGFPGLNGFASKTLIHHAIVEAEHVTHNHMLLYAERVFTLTSALTACYFIKLGTAFFGPERGHAPHGSESWSTRIALGALALVMLAIGIFPEYLLERWVVPTAASFGLTGHALSELAHAHFFEWESIQHVLIPLGAAVMLFVFGTRFRLFEIKPPVWLSVEYLVYRPLVQLGGLACQVLGVRCNAGVLWAYDEAGRLSHAITRHVVGLDTAIESGYQRVAADSRALISGATTLDQGIDGTYDSVGRQAKDLASVTGQFDRSLNIGYERTAEVSKGLVTGATSLDRSISAGYEKGAEASRSAVRGAADAEASSESKRPSQPLWSAWNLNFAALLLAGVLMIVFMIFLLYGKA